jgi:hypothetical protein
VSCLQNYAEFAKDYASALAVAQPRKLFVKKFDLQLRNKSMILSSFNRIPTCCFHTHGEGETCHLIGAKGELRRARLWK